MRTASSSGMVVVEPVSVDGATSSFTLPEILDEEEKVVVVVKVGSGVGLKVTSTPHISQVVEEDCESE